MPTIREHKGTVTSNRKLFLVCGLLQAFNEADCSCYKIMLQNSMPLFSGRGKWNLMTERKRFPNFATGNYYQMIHELLKSMSMYIKAWPLNNWATKFVENVAKVAHYSWIIYDLVTAFVDVFTLYKMPAGKISEINFCFCIPRKKDHYNY